jgi:acetyl-CoA synthetase
MSKIINKQNLWKNYWTKDGYFKMFDIGSYKKDALYVHGRNDDVINIRGHRIGSEEIESILLKIKSIAELAAVAVKDNLEAARIVLFVVLNNQNNVKKVQKDINAKILSFFGSYALPKKIFYIPSLPKTRSGKILRRLLRDFVENPNNNEYSNLSTILDYSTIKKIKNIIKNEKF